MFKHRRYRTGWYYLTRLLLLAVLCGAAWWYAPKYLEKTKTEDVIDINKILVESPLKNKKFSAKVQKVKSGNLTAYLMEENSNPIVSLSFIFKKAGTAYVPANKQGVAFMTASMLTAGTKKYTEKEFREALDEYGIKMQFSASTDDFIGFMAVPTKNLDKAKALLQSALSEPILDDEYMQLVKQQMQMALQQQNELPNSELANKYREFIFNRHPYSRNRLGVQKDIFFMMPDDVRDYMKKKFAKDNLVVGISGNISAKKSAELLQDLFGMLPEKAKTKSLEKIEFSTRGTDYEVNRKTPQTITKFVAKGTYRDSIDFYPLYVANYIFGESGLNSRLSKNIREKEGLTYGIYTYLSDRDAVALIEGSFSATPENFAKARQLLQKEWLRLAQEGITEEELYEAKNSLLSSFNLRFASITDISDMLVAMQKYNLGIDFLDMRNDYIAKVSLKEVNAAAKKYFSTLPDFVIIGTYQ